MERITSRKNAYIVHLRQLSSDGEYRRSCREYLCDGPKMLEEAQAWGAEITSVLWVERKEPEQECGVPEYTAPKDLFDYVCPMKNSPGPLFTVRMPSEKIEGMYDRVIVLENVQDPGNVGTVIRSANAFRMDAVILTGACADLYSPKTVRATMGAIFRQKIFCFDLEQLTQFCRERALPLYGAALSDLAQDIREMPVSRCAVAVGSEGRGLSPEIRDKCARELIIPMNPDSESLNAGIAASVIMWEMARENL